MSLVVTQKYHELLLVEYGKKKIESWKLNAEILS